MNYHFLSTPQGRAQRGATLLVAMIFMIVLMLVVASAVRIGNVNTRIVGNMQTQKEAESSEQKAIEETISFDFTKLPKAQVITVDINNSGQTGSTYTVNVDTPQCITVKPIKTLDLNTASTDDAPCFASGTAQNTGIIGAMPSGNSLCSDAMWNLRATATPPNTTLPAAALNQGVTQRVDPGANC